MYILDTNVISELRKAKKAHPNVKKWAERLPSASLCISVISVLELEIGILLIERRDKEQGAILRGWPTQAFLWLEWGSSTAGHNFPAARSRFRAVHSDSISTRLSAPVA
jgi:predicted nucleic acid-binding protein